MLAIGTGCAIASITELDLTADPTRFASLCLHRARRSLPEAQARARARLSGEGWDAKAAQFERWITASS